jgi:hypothetical protein
MQVGIQEAIMVAFDSALADVNSESDWAFFLTYLVHMTSSDVLSNAR